MPAANSSLEAAKPVSDHLREMALQAVRDFPGCFWWWNTEFIPQNEEEVREIVTVLRKAGGRQAWDRAQALVQCL